MRPYAYNYGAWEAEERGLPFETILEDTVHLWTAWTSEWDRVSVNKQASRRANKITRPLGFPVRSSFLPVELSFLWRRIVSEPAGESREICTSRQDSKDPEGRNDFKRLPEGHRTWGVILQHLCGAVCTYVMCTNEMSDTEGVWETAPGLKGRNQKPVRRG